MDPTNDATTNATVRYVAIGDSYSVGEGATPAEAWPQLLADHLSADGIPTTLVANPGKTGWTTQQAIDHELSVLQTSDPDFVTILLGVNDYVQGVSVDIFRGNFKLILDQAVALVGVNRVIVLTIPDYTITSTGQQFGDPVTNAIGIQQFNSIIRELSTAQNVTVIDLFPISQAMGTDTTLVAPDGLHPSAQEYAIWEGLIYQVVLPLLQLNSK